MMSLLLPSFIQLQGMGWLTWVIIGGIVLLALFLIFFFVKGIKRAEKETDEEWGLSRRSLFTNAPAPAGEKPELTEERGTGVRTAELEAVAPPPETAPLPVGETLTPASPAVAGERAGTEPLKSAPVSEPEPEAESPRPILDPSPVTERREQPPAREDRGTELLVSKGPERVEHADEPTPFDDEVWAGLEIEDRPLAETPVADEALEAQEIEAPRIIPPVPPSARREARVEHRPRETFEPPIIESVKRREPFEPPDIEPLHSPDEPPREAPKIAAPKIAAPKIVETRPLAAVRDAAPQEPALQPEIEAPIYSDERAGEPAAPRAVGASGQSDLWRAQRTGSVPDIPAEARRSGSILNLPADASDAPLVFGEPAPDRDARAIGSLSNYGKDPDAGKGRKWIGLVVLLGVVVAAALLYFFVRPINERVDEWFARVRGRNLAASKPPAAPDFKAQIFPARAEVNANSSTAKARGRVINASDAPLEGLSVEVELVRRDNGPPDIRTCPVNPSTLAPSQQGNFEFDIDLKQQTAAYKVNKLIGKDGEISFKTPAQNKPQAQPQPQSQ